MRRDTHLGTPFKLLFLIFVVLGLYYPAILSDFTQIDDPRIMGYLEDTNPTLLEILRPGQSHYYRPLIFLSFYVDKYLWGLEPSFMHLENILLHGANTLLVFSFAARVFRDESAVRNEVPLLSALLFAVHPINTEAVSWVSGRTDPLATVFVLLAAYILVGNVVKSRLLSAILASAAIFTGCLAKEVAFFFFPVAWLLQIARNNALYRPYLALENLKRVILSALPFLIFSLSYLALRQSGLKVRDNSVAMMMKSDGSWVDTFLSAFKAFGFYVKKLFLPLPLNFAIMTYSDLYVWLGMFATVLTVWLLCRRRICFGLLAASFFLVLPAIVVAVKKIAWTPVAERYLYCPSAFFVIAMVGWGAEFFRNRVFERYFIPLILFLAVAASVATVKRNLLWQDTFHFYEDTATKSPLSDKVQNEYAIALIVQGRFDEASKRLGLARGYDRNNFLVPMNQARIMLLKSDDSAAIEILEGASKTRKSNHPEILKMLAGIREKQFAKTTDKRESNRLLHELIDIYHYVYQGTMDPFIAYRSGQLLLSAGERQKALAMFECALRDAPRDAHYREAAKKLVAKLGDK